MPILVSYKKDVFAKLHAAAADSQTPLDDVAVVALEKLVDQYIK
jgi:hypothetical protein